MRTVAGLLLSTLLLAASGADASSGGCDGAICFGAAAPPGPEWSSLSPFVGSVPWRGPPGAAVLAVLLLGYAAFGRSRR